MWTLNGAEKLNKWILIAPGPDKTSAINKYNTKFKKRLVPKDYYQHPNCIMICHLLNWLKGTDQRIAYKCLAF